MSKLSKELTKVLETIEKYAPIRPSQLGELLGVSSKTVHKHLSKLVDMGEVIKTGSSPTVFYSVKKDFSTIVNDIGNIDDFLIEKNYVFISSDGQIYRGLAGFQLWCAKNKFNLSAEKSKFIKKLKQVDKLKSNGLISAKKIILSAKKDLYLDEIFYSDFYTLDYFGKTKLGQLVYLGKTSSNKALIREIAELIKPAISSLINKYQIQQVFFIPPTIDRKVQFLKVLKDALKLDLTLGNIQKTPGPNIAQKTIRKLEDRIQNAQNTIAVDPTQKIAGNILIIDDATGSGATLNETAKKIRNFVGKEIKIIGYSVVGSSKGFDVISEV